ncbi:hypothetical protein Save01_07229 [Streptomyces avermitilis]
MSCTATAPRSHTITPWAATTALPATSSAPNPSALALRAAKNSLDPHHILNPGVLLD